MLPWVYVITDNVGGYKSVNNKQLLDYSLICRYRLVNNL